MRRNGAELRPRRQARSLHCMERMRVDDDAGAEPAVHRRMHRHLLRRLRPGLLHERPFGLPGEATETIGLELSEIAATWAADHVTALRQDRDVPRRSARESEVDEAPAETDEVLHVVHSISQAVMKRSSLPKLPDFRRTLQASRLSDASSPEVPRAQETPGSTSSPSSSLRIPSAGITEPEVSPPATRNCLAPEACASRARAAMVSSTASACSREGAPSPRDAAPEWMITGESGALAHSSSAQLISSSARRTGSARARGMSIVREL